LRSGERAEEYEKRIASLEYQLEMLKRQVGESALSAVPAAGSANLLLFNLRGQVLRQSFTLDGLTSGAELARFNDDPAKEPVPPGLLVISPARCSSPSTPGRTVTLPGSQNPTHRGALDWRKAYRVDPRPGNNSKAITRDSWRNPPSRTNRAGRRSSRRHGARQAYALSARRPWMRTIGAWRCAATALMVLDRRPAGQQAVDGHPRPRAGRLRPSAARIMGKTLNFRCLWVEAPQTPNQTPWLKQENFLR
jgi:hypothetical protein